MSIMMPPNPNINEVEEWKPILGYEGLYDVSNTGKIRRYMKTTKKTKLCSLRQTIGITSIVHLCKDSKKKQYMVAKLVISHFTEAWDFDRGWRSFTVRYNDDQRTNCHFNNLTIQQDAWLTHRPERVNKGITDEDKWVKSRPYVAYYYDCHGTRFIRFRRTWDPEDGGGKRQLDKSLKFDPTKQTNRVNRTFYEIKWAYRNWLVKNKMFNPKQSPPAPLHYLSFVVSNIDKKMKAAIEKDKQDNDETIVFIDEEKELLENKLLVENYEKRPSKMSDPSKIYTSEDFVESFIGEN
tara:strand:+ start:489 stop:1370 length:882 start_codon:yes stop_codon:yes gene_type:complete